VGDFMHEKFLAIVKDQLGKDLSNTSVIAPEIDPFSLERLLYGIFLMRMKRENIRSGSANIFDVSLGNFGIYKEFPGHSYVELKHGFGPVLNAFIGSQKEAFYARVNFKHYLKKIVLDSSLVGVKSLLDTRSDEVRGQFTSDKNKAVLFISDARDEEKPRDFVVVADNVICTMSLGYWKENLNNIIEPLSFLSAERRQSVNRVGFGTINKA
jgi:hypothetical protein